MNQPYKRFMAHNDKNTHQQPEACDFYIDKTWIAIQTKRNIIF